MKSFSITIPALLAALASAAPAEKRVKQATPTIYMAGDSTMALGGGGPGTNGWGVYFPFSVKNATVENDAIGGRSARSFTDQGRFASLVQKVVPGDFVIIEFGHNDGGSPVNRDNKRSACPGSGNETCTTPEGLIVQTYGTYLTNATRALVAKGAQVIISSQTPNNICEGANSNCTYTPPRFTEYARKVVLNVGINASFIDHGLYVANEYKRLGKAKVDTFYPHDHTHTSPEGANVVAQAYVKAVLCDKGVLAPFIKNTTASVPGNCA